MQKLKAKWRRKKECDEHTSSSSTSANELLNIQFATKGLVPIPSSKAASRTEARRALDSREIVSETVPDELFSLWVIAGRGIGA